MYSFLNAPPKNTLKFPITPTPCPAPQTTTLNFFHPKGASLKPKCTLYNQKLIKFQQLSIMHTDGSTKSVNIIFPFAKGDILPLIKTAGI